MAREPNPHFRSELIQYIEREKRKVKDWTAELNVSDWESAEAIVGRFMSVMDWSDHMFDTAAALHCLTRLLKWVDHPMRSGNDYQDWVIMQMSSDLTPVYDYHGSPTLVQMLTTFLGRKFGWDTVKVKTPAGELALQVISEASAKGRPPLRDLGRPIDWAHSGHAIHQ